MSTGSVEFKIDGKHVSVSGYPELEGCQGVMSGDGMAFFFPGRGMYAANTVTGNIRCFSSGGYVHADDSEIDYEAIAKECVNGYPNARSRQDKYAGMNRWDGFKEGLCAISWMLYPDGQYFADSDGYGMRDNDEENVYAIIDTGLEIVEPFRPVNNVGEYLGQLRKNKC